MTKKKSRKPESSKPVKIPAAVAEFIIKPRGLPHPQGDLNAYLKQCEKNLLEMLVEAMSPTTGILPKRTVMVQCLSNKPVTGKADFSLPVLIRAGNKTAACHLAASFAHVTHYLIRGKSSHVRMRSIGDCTRGNLVVFASNKPKTWLSTDFANVVHVALPVSSNRPVPDFRDVFESLGNEFLSSSDDLWRFEMKSFVDRASEKCWGAITQPITDGLLPPDSKPKPCSKAKRHDRTEAVLAHILQDSEYLQRVPVLLATGQIILCLPQTHFFEDRRAATHHAESVVFDSGLTIVLAGDKQITKEELEQCYWVGYVVASFLAGVHGLSNKLSQEVRRKVTHTLTKTLSHEVGNVGESINSRLELTTLDIAARQDVAARTYIAATAARAVVAEGDLNEYKPVAEQTKIITGYYLKFSDFNLDVCPYDVSSLTAIELPPAFTLLLNELLRNAYKHAVIDKNRFRHARLEIYCDKHFLILKVSNQPKNEDKLVALRDGFYNSESQRLGRLRELASLLDAELMLHEESPEITLTVKLTIHT